LCGCRRWGRVSSRIETHKTTPIGTSSSGRTTDSGSVSGSSTLSVPAMCASISLARSSSGLGRRPLKAEISSSNLLRATTRSRVTFGWPAFLCMSTGAKAPLLRNERQGGGSLLPRVGALRCATFPPSCGAPVAIRCGGQSATSCPLAYGDGWGSAINSPVMWCCECGMLSRTQPRADSSDTCLARLGLVCIFRRAPHMRTRRIKHLALKSPRGLATLSIRFQKPHKG
jgi:hypothetical protein